MDTLELYRQSIQTLITEYAEVRNSVKDDVEAEIIFDEKRDRYQLIYIGWDYDNKRRIFGPVLHFDIKDGKIWIQWNGTEDDVAEKLVGMGVAKENIVIGFHPPSLRKYTEYAIG